MTLRTDPTKPRAIDASGQAHFTIGEVELHCADNLIEDDLEKQVAWFLMNYGNWFSEELPPEIVNDELISIGFRFEPPERSNPDEHFEIVGHLSQMVSREFNGITAPDGSVKFLLPQREPDTLGVAIPADYKGEQLPLWRFTITPS